MDFTISVAGYESLSLADQVPASLEQYHIPGSKIISAVATFGSFMIQEIGFDEFNCRYMIFEMKEDVSLMLTSSIPVVIARIALGGHFEYHVAALGNFIAGENTFNIFYAKLIQIPFILKKETMLQLI
jgi:hypothetical protein